MAKKVQWNGVVQDKRPGRGNAVWLARKGRGAVEEFQRWMDRTTDPIADKARRVASGKARTKPR